MSTTIIPAGYRLTVRTWENDADNWATEVVEGLTHRQVSFYVELAKLFDSKNAHKPGIGNMYEPTTKELAKIAKAAEELFNKFPEFAEDEFVEDEESAVDALLEHAYEIGAAGNGEFTTRVVDSWKIELIPTDIVLEDVTKEFQ